MHRNQYIYEPHSEARACLFCGGPIQVQLNEIKRGRGRYCSIACSAAGRTKRRLEDRFWPLVGEKTESGCILWKGKRRPDGYGIIVHMGKDVRAARVSYELCVGPIPAGLFVCHRCDNPPCVNPVHLFAGTHAQNMADMVAKGRRVGRPRKSPAAQGLLRRNG